MATDLIFLTTSSGAIPTGRNARTQARTQSARRNNNPAHQRTGKFSSFEVKLPSPPRRKPTEAEPCSKRQHDVANPAPYQPVREAAKAFALARLVSPRLSNTLPAPGIETPIRPNAVYLTHLSRLARFHIGRLTAGIAEGEPSRLASVLRCRQWCYAPYIPSHMGSSACLNTAVDALSLKMNNLLLHDSPRHTSTATFASYGRALVCLRERLDRSPQRVTPDVLAAVQLLTIYEMLDLSDDEAWQKHATGAVALIRTATYGKPSIALQTTLSTKQAWPLLTEALLNHERSGYTNIPCQAVARSVLARPRANGEIRPEVCDCVTAVAGLADEAHFLRTSASGDWSMKYALLSQAHCSRLDLRDLVMSSKAPSPLPPMSGPSSDELGLCLASLVALDSLIASLMPKGPTWHQAQNLQQETHELCAQMLRLEMQNMEVDPMGWAPGAYTIDRSTERNRVIG